MTIESTDEFVSKMGEHYTVLLKSVAGRPMEFTEVLANATFWMKVFHEAYGNDPMALGLFEVAIGDMELGTARIPHDSSGRVH
jgi:hypothetical protein